MLLMQGTTENAIGYKNQEKDWRPWLVRDLEVPEEKQQTPRRKQWAEKNLDDRRHQRLNPN
jgi:hypothetical protein